MSDSEGRQRTVRPPETLPPQPGVLGGESAKEEAAETPPAADLLGAADPRSVAAERPPTVYRVATGAQPSRIWRGADGLYYGEVRLVAEGPDVPPSPPGTRRRTDTPPAALPESEPGAVSRRVSAEPPRRGGGRHSRPPAAAERTRSAGPARRVRDTGGRALRPDPARVATAAEFVEAMRQYRLWAGAPSFEEMTRNCGEVCSVASFHAALNSTALPKLPLLNAFIMGCGGDEEEFRRWADARQRLVAREQG